jgi:subtilase family serine protease
VLACTGLFGVRPASATPSAASSLVAIPGSFPATTDKVTGRYQSSRMTIEVALAPRDASGLAEQLTATYSRRSGHYQQWLAKGAFDGRYAPTVAERTAVATYLRSSGLAVGRSKSPFLITATGSSRRVATAFHTTLSTYRDPHGVRYFSNSSKVRMPSTLSSGVIGVIGLSNTAREHAMIERSDNVKRPTGTTSPTTASCEAPYPTAAQLYAAVDDGTSFPFGYGGGPGCNGLTPSQTNSIYGAPHFGPRGKGKGVTMAVFELSAYQQSDIDTWAHTFYGSTYHPPLQDISVDGGPLSPVCPAGDTCPPQYNYYAGDVEVDADIEMQLAVAPDAKTLEVYNAPNDYTGQTELDEYTQIAHDDTAEVVSSSWAVCENDETAAYVQAENVIFEQMALQGQSMFGAEGDTGAFSCIRSDGTTIPNVLDPPSQPWVTSVGGTSLESDNPGTNPHPAYPKDVETVWNVDDLCNTSSDEGGQTGYFWCGATGAGGGGSSQWWGRPFYQHGPGVNNPYTTHANGTSQCALAATGTPCREDPDISANADEYTPYAEYCTNNADTPYGICGAYSSPLAPGWFGVGGTSLSSPLWSAIIADRDSFHHHRSGNINPLLYVLLDIDQNLFFHDITGIGQSTTDNGLFPTTRGYDEATGIGTPKMAALITVPG